MLLLIVEHVISGDLGGVIEERFQTQAARIPFAFDAVAAAADTNPDYPGSCGRCYEVRCKSGLVYGTKTVTFE